MAKALVQRVIVGLTAVALTMAATACGSNTSSSSSSHPAPAGSAPSSSSSSSGSSKNLTPVTVSYTALGFIYGPLFVAKDLGLFKKNGLNVKIIFANSASSAIPALVSKSADIVETDGAAPLIAASKGVKNVRLFGTNSATGYLEVWAQGNITSAKDLVGKKIGATNPGAKGDIVTGVWLEEHGVKRSQVHMVYLRGLGNLVAAMKAKKIAATLILPPLGEEAASVGAHKLGDLRNLKYASNVDIALSGYLNTHPKVAIAFLKAQSEAVSILKTQPNKAIPILEKYTKIHKTSWAQYGYNYYKPIWTLDPKVEMSVLQSTVKTLSGFHPGLKKLDLATYVDNAFADKIDSSGFLKTLAK